jgi:probable rRNA maturation factor
MKRKRRARTAASKEREPAIENRQKVVRVRLRGLLHFADRLRDELGLGEDSLAVRLISNVEMARLNKNYRGKKGATDVLSFPADDRRKPGNLRTQLRKMRGTLLGDIAISPAVAKRNAKIHNRHFVEELQILILHGVLHLLGYDHETDRGEMQRVEVRLRRRLGIA